MGRHLFLPIFVILMITSTFGKNLELDIFDDYESEENLESDIVNIYEPLNPFEENLDSDVDDFDPLNPFEVPLEEARATQTATPLPVDKFDMFWDHNVYRGQAAKMYGASNIQIMWWDSNIAKQAQNYANKCIFGHSDIAKAGIVGENLARFFDNKSNRDPKELQLESVWGWAKESHRPQGSFQPWAKGPYVTGHWTALIWAKTNRFGCGLARCSPGKKYPKYKYTYQMVCQYSPAGNVQGENVFELGKPCSNCEVGCAQAKFGQSESVLCLSTDLPKEHQLREIALLP